MGVGEERGGGAAGEGGRKRAGASVPRVPNPKLVPERDGVSGVPWDTYLHSEVSDARRLLRLVLEVLGHRGGVNSDCDMGTELLQDVRVVSGNSRCEVLGRVSPGRVG